MSGREGALEHVFTPLHLGGVEVRNRVFVAAHSTNFSERLASDRLTAYYRERARHGVGLIIQEPAIVHPSSLSRPTKVWAYDPDNVERFRSTTDAVHAEGTKIFCQLLHNGAHMGRYFSGMPVWAPSELFDAMSGDMAHAMSRDEVAEVVEGFATSAEHCRLGGFDGVEIHGSHGYLIQQFLSPLTNHRTDAYGGDVAGRRRFLLEILRAVRARVGADFVVGVRLAGDERAAGGMTPVDVAHLVADLEADQLVDYVNVSTGAAASPGWIVLDATYPRRANVDVARQIRAATSLPVLVAGRVAEPEEAEAILAEGAADMVGVVRALIADPRWLEKARAGAADTIRPCTYCNECIAGIGVYRPIRCTVNPDMGHEGEPAPWRDGPATARRVVVVGGGPAGLECATTAAELGHDVVLLEASGALGGQAIVAPDPGMRPEAVRIGHHLVALAGRLPVDVRLGQAATADDVVALGPDVVVVATGSAVLPPSVEGAVHTVDAFAVLTGAAEVGRRVLVFEDGTRPWELEVVVDQLARDGHEVVVVTTGTGLQPRGTDVSFPGRVAAAGVQVLGSRVVTSVHAGGVATRHLQTGERGDEDGFDAVVLAGGRTASSALLEELRGRVPTVVGIGDALAPRMLRDALHEGRAVARSL